MTVRLSFLDPARRKVEATLAPYTRRVTSFWTNTTWFKKLARKVS